MPKKENPDWLKERLEVLTNLAEKVKIDGLTTDYHDFTALKLIAIHYYASIFSRVVFNQKEKGWCDGAVYVDLFAGTGLVKLKGSKYDDFLPGSPSCAALTQNKFDYIVCVESSKERCQILEKRLAKIFPRENFDVIHDDCNNSIIKVTDLINQRFRKPILLTFVDPEGLEIKFSTLKTLSDNFPKCDFMVNVNSLGVKRVGGKFKKGIENIKDSLEAYYDSDANIILQELAEGKEPEEKYAELIQNTLGKKMGNIIKIKDDGDKIAYYILGYTRETQSGSKYSKGFEDLERRLNWADKTKVRRAIERIHNRQSGLEDFSF